MSNSTDPRAARTRAAILVAARSLLLDEGPAALTHQRVAQEAGVGRATVYRHWPQAEQLLHDVMTGVDIPFFRKPEVPVRPWLCSQLRDLADELATPRAAGAMLTLTQSALWDPHVAAQRDHCLDALDERLRIALDLAAGNGEIDVVPDPPDVSALLVGPLVYRTAMRGGTVSDQLIDRLVDGLGRWRPPGPSARESADG
ncbi:TetR/AcrR family transcriptional regulator [Microbispora corallina]|uniref:TetR family transcriptional regulator n=1 Tax=Microbispora corallina TaxID=83302 RepID=A0ABQ4GBA5_9ACTN|nr:TetR/AcrR family transcriptional regulator [Microbispora corallina]GIH44325.1 TetR family transcriptional regulator [Microbispora corallina]